MKTIHKKDLTTVSNGIILHGVNCQGVMGGGIAYALVRAYPKIFHNYKNLCDYARSPYELLGTIDPVEITPDLTIVNCFTQNFFGTAKPPASYSAIHDCLTEVVKRFNDSGKNIFMPPIGCGLGGLEWNIVNDIVEYIEGKHKTQIIVCDL